MTVAVLFAAAVVRGVRRPRWKPGGVAEVDAEFFDSVAAELRRGASLRHAVAWAAPATRASRLALAGQPLPLVVAELHKHLDLADVLAGAGIELAGRSGAPSVEMFRRLAVRSRARGELARSRRTLTAQARLSAAVIGLIPPCLGLAVVAGRGVAVFSGGPSRTVVMVGLGLQLLGLALVAILIQGHR